MPGLLLHQGATVLCAHGGQATPAVPSTRVRVEGQFIVTQPPPWTIAGCPFVAGTTPMPCVTGTWITGAIQLASQGQPVLLQDSQATCIPNGTPVSIVLTQMRVQGK